tara:strand:- start:110 stop:1069 length:960 start_codon:yes stop_codon:yes gene_type:complete
VQYLNEIDGVNAALNDWDNYSKYDVAIFGKNTSFSQLSHARRIHPTLLIGDTNPSNSKEKIKKSKFADFLITGSIEEKDFYLDYKKPIVMFPQIEDFKGVSPKHHIDKQTNEAINIGYHGNKRHIQGLSRNLIESLEVLGSERKVTLSLLYDVQTLGRAKLSIKNVEIKHIQWRLDHFAKEILKFDIGISPGLTSVPRWLKFLYRYFPTSTGHISDYVLRYKNTANAGRAFVFHQLGIPVVADMTPAHFNMLADGRCGYLAHSKEGWYNALKELSDSAHIRNLIAQNATARFDELYDTKIWAETLVKDLNQLLIKKCSH